MSEKFINVLMHQDGCGCGHHHEHEHQEEECCGGHDHNGDGECCGNHDHHHDGECCGGHDHHHEDSCGCGHDHNGDKVMIGTMGGHIVGTMITHTPASLPIAEMNMNLSMKDVALSIKEMGGVPMQMKASMKDNQRTVVMNMLGSDIYRSEQEGSTEDDPTRVRCRLLAVADGISSEQLKEKLEEIMGYFQHNSF